METQEVAAMIHKLDRALSVAGWGWMLFEENLERVRQHEHGGGVSTSPTEAAPQATESDAEAGAPPEPSEDQARQEPASDVADHHDAKQESPTTERRTRRRRRQGAELRDRIAQLSAQVDTLTRAVGSLLERRETSQENTEVVVDEKGPVGPSRTVAEDSAAVDAREPDVEHEHAPELPTATVVQLSDRRVGRHEAESPVEPDREILVVEDPGGSTSPSRTPDRGARGGKKVRAPPRRARSVSTGPP